MGLFSKLVAHVKDKHVHIATHWDCDGVTSGALLYHLLKPHAKKITTISKGEVFEVLQQDVPSEADIVICSDIQPSMELDPLTTIYIDHHPFDRSDDLLLSIRDDQIQSCSLLIHNKLICDTKNSYYLFLTLLGYFGDSGDFNQLSPDLQIAAKEHFGHLLEKRTSRAGNSYYPLQLYVSMFNTGKRIHWNGFVPLELLKSVTDYKDILLGKHPLVQELERYKLQLRQYYNMQMEVTAATHVDYALIECDKNVQGVLCSRYLKNKPIVVMNKYKGNIIASMRVPDSLEFDAGAFLSKAKEIVQSPVGGGHEKAGGITFSQDHLNEFIAYLEDESH